jgi:hypothetical protein
MRFIVLNKTTHTDFHPAALGKEHPL